MKLICVGRNYAAHIEELKNSRPSEPLLFLKPQSALVNAKNGFSFPSFSRNIRYETEVLIKISHTAKNIAVHEAWHFYQEIGLGIDFTAADIQEQCKQKGQPWEKAKAFDGSALVGNFINKENFSAIQNITFSLVQNEKTVQIGNTSDMLWSMDELLAYSSRFFTLEAGDILFSGTPAGIGNIHSGDLLCGYLQEKEMFSLSVN